MTDHPAGWSREAWNEKLPRFSIRGGEPDVYVVPFFLSHSHHTYPCLYVSGVSGPYSLRPDSGPKWDFNQGHYFVDHFRKSVLTIRNVC